MARITLEPSSILQYIPMLLPQGRPIASNYEALAALIHAINSALDLQLVGVEETASQTPVEGGVLPEHWNARAPDFTLVYREPQSSQVILFKVTKVGAKSQIHGILEQKDQTASTDMTTSNFVSPTYFQSQGNEEPLVHGYVSSDRVAEFITKYIKDILRPLLPDLNYEPREQSANLPPPSDEGPQRPRLLDDEENNNRTPPLHQPYEYPQRTQNPLEVGRSDLDPIPNPFAGVQPIQPLNPGGGMYVGPGHPIFGPGSNRGPGGRGPWGGDGFLPPMGAPPGARFDPVVPFGAGGVGGIPRGGPRPPQRGPFSGEPDNDEFLPPRFGGGSGPGGNHDDMYM